MRRPTAGKAPSFPAPASSRGGAGGRAAGAGPAAASAAQQAPEEAKGSVLNVVVGVVIGCLVVFGVGALSRPSSGVGGAHGSTHSGLAASGHSNSGGSQHHEANHPHAAAPGGGGKQPGENQFESPPDPDEGATSGAGGGKGGKDGCKCSRHCVHVNCRKIHHHLFSNASSGKAINDGHIGERELNLLAQSMEFGRCAAESCLKDASGHCVAETLGTERARCSGPQRRVVNKLRQCMIPALKAPKAFTLERDTISGLSVVCRGDVATETCRSLEGEGRAAYDEIAAMMQMQLRHSENGAAFVDIGDTDGLLDMRIAGIPNVTVHVLSANPEQRNIAHLTACLNDLLDDRVHVAKHTLNAGVGVNHRSHVTAVKGRPAILRVAAPGYEETLSSDLNGTVAAMQPAAIVALGDAKALGEWLMPLGYVAWNPRVCRFANAQEDVGKVGLVGTRRATSVWVPGDTGRGLIVPHCREACVVPTCQGGWRTEYRPCTHKEYCTSDDLESKPESKMQDSCYWKNTPAACKRDNNWQRVIKCADPLLPVSTFSLIDVRGSLLACRGERDCAGVDTHQHDYTMNILTSFFNQLRDTKKFTPEYVSIGAFVGNVGFAVARAGIEVHLFEPVPSTRQWLKISKCLAGVSNIRVYDSGVGPADEECAIAPSASALEGNINVTCPAPPKARRVELADDTRHDVIVPFRTLNTIHRHLQFEAHSAKGSSSAAGGGASSPAAGHTALQRGFVLHFDEAVDPYPLLRAGTRWLGDADWNPAVILVAGNAPDAEATEAFLKTYGYSKASIPGQAPRDWAGIAVFLASNKGR